MKLPIAYYGEPILRARGQKIETIDDALKKLIEDMIETMYANNGMGLAAQQVFEAKALFVAAFPRHDENGKYYYEKPKAYLNPNIVEYSKETCVVDEPCVSIPGLCEPVTRSIKITIEYTDLHGKTHRETHEGMDARLLMHETDHTNGILYIDRMTDKKRRKLIDPVLNRIKKQYSRKK